MALGPKDSYRSLMNIRVWDPPQAANSLRGSHLNALAFDVCLSTRCLTLPSSRCLALIKAFFDAVDVNHNGEISLDELMFFLDDASRLAFRWVVFQ